MFLRGTEHLRYCFIIAIHVLIFVNVYLKDSRESNNTENLTQKLKGQLDQMNKSYSLNISSFKFSNSLEAGFLGSNLSWLPERFMQVTFINVSEFHL